MIQEKSAEELRPLILVAEDDDSNFKLIKAIIGKKFNIAWAKNGQEVIDLFKQHQEEAKAILMDIKMPVMTGLEATTIIRSLSPDIPIIIQTAYAFSTDRENAINAGATQVLVKPITLSVLRDCISQFFPETKW
ncbi:MAG: response regulator [Bacteroides sp.]|nr:response regulator [Bacteroides sp.]